MERRPAGVNHIEYHVVGSRAQFRDGDVKRVVIGDKAIALYQLEGDIFATDDACTHAYGSLSEGYVEGEEIECPLHGGRFNIRTGEATAPPVTEDLDTYEVRIEGENVLIGIPA